MEICGYELSVAKSVGTVVLVIATFGLALVLIAWRKNIKYQLLYRPTQLVQARKVLLTDLRFHQVFEETVVRLQSEVYFINKKKQVCLGRNSSTVQKTQEHRRKSQPVRLLQDAGTISNRGKGQVHGVRGKCHQDQCSTYPTPCHT